MPRVDHIAFITNDLDFIKNKLIENNIYFRHYDPPDTNIHQIFLFDPDGNVIEVSNCAPTLGERTC
jgi:hypothetical protein